MTSINTAVRFHGHLGPWLIIGLIMGRFGLKKIKAKKYFGLEIYVSIPNRKPISCLIDGLQLSSGCTLGKGNIKVIPSNKIKVKFRNLKNNKMVLLGLSNNIIDSLNVLKTHRDCENFARQIYSMRPNQVVEILGGTF
jgi:formylmethanofuran dehydrogenase subunit E